MKCGFSGGVSYLPLNGKKYEVLMGAPARL